MQRYRVYLESVRGGRSKRVVVEAESRSDAAVTAEAKHKGYVSCDEVLIGTMTADGCRQEA